MIRTPLAPASATVVTLNGLAAVPAPLTSVCETGVHGVRRADAARPPSRRARRSSGANSVPAVKTSVPQSPGLAEEGKSSKRASPR